MSVWSQRKALEAIKTRNAEQGTPQPVVGTLNHDRVAQAKVLEADILAKIEWLQGEPNSEVKKARMGNYMDRLGELLAEQGQYEKAYAVTKSKDRRDYYKSVLKAIKIDDAKECECPDEVLVDRAAQKEFTQKSMLVVNQIVTEKGVLNLEKCIRCGFLQAR